MVPIDAASRVDRVMDARPNQGSLVVRTVAVAALAIVGVVAPRAAAAEDPRDAPEAKSGVAATGLAIGGTLGGFALMAAGGSTESDGLAWVGLGVATVGPS